MSIAVIKYLVCAAVLAAPAHAQFLTHPLAASGADAVLSPRALITLPDTVRVLAVMVQFQQDDDVRTTGDGRFLLGVTSDTVLDAPPHDGQYFRLHCTFLENYFTKVSKGRIVPQCTLLDSVFTLRESMSNFSSPSGGSIAPLFDLARETWQMVDSSGLIPAFGNFQCFVVFHAGVGHDVDLVGTLGYDPSPSDLPSIYLGPHAWETTGGGVSVNGGSFRIANTILMPETESRSLPGISGDVPLVLGINGLFCASFGNYLGLPDLFNTKTGGSGIGRFGLMDGESIFSFSGAFPPEPSAWEKYWLGLADPITVEAGTRVLELPAVALADTIFRIPISDGEYFLLENRNRDPRQNGQRVTSVLNGVTRTRTYGSDTTGFNAFDISGLAGSVTDVEDFDWSLPGGIGEDGTIFNGGILIWHIDESVIRKNITSNAVNADPDHRGVDVEEADGSQDIGQQYDAFTPGSGSEQGTALDFWFDGNISPVYKNAFSATTFPNSNGYGGAQSHVTVDNFSASGPHMSVRVTRGDEVTPIAGFPRQTREVLDQNVLSVGQFGQLRGGAILVGTSGMPLAQVSTDTVIQPASGPGKLFLFPTDSIGGFPAFKASGVIAASTSSLRGFTTAPAIADVNGDGSPDIVAVESSSGSGSAVRIFSVASRTSDSLATELSNTELPGSINVPPVVGDSLIAVGTDAGSVYFLRRDGGIADSLSGQLTGGAVSGIGRWHGGDEYVLTFANGSVRLMRRNADGSAAAPDVQHVFGGGSPLGLSAPAVCLIPPGRTVIVFTSSARELYLVDSTLTPLPGFPVTTGSTGMLSPPALADIDGDGTRDMIFFGGSQIFAYNTAGVLLDHFPVNVGGVISACSPIIGDVDGDGVLEIVGIADNGIAFAVSKDGREAAGWPIAVGTGRQSLGFISGSQVPGVCSASGDGSISAWRTGRASSLANPFPWSQWGSDGLHSARSIGPIGGIPISSEFFPKGRVYNWPNPVYDNVTHFRYFVNENATVRISIFNLAGELVIELSGQGVGGMDNEIAWNASGVQSGVYFARFEATGQHGSGTAIVKVAVVK